MTGDDKIPKSLLNLHSRSNKEVAMSEKLLNVKEVSEYLDISRKEVEDLVDKGRLPAYKIGGSFLRFKKHELDIIKSSLNLPTKKRHYNEVTDYTLNEKIKDFFYFNDFYIISIAVIVTILIMIFRS